MKSEGIRGRILKRKKVFSLILMGNHFIMKKRTAGCKNRIH